MRLSDALRNAADSAPVGESHVAVADAARRVKRHRALRTGSQAMVGAAGVAVLALAVVTPGGLSASSDDSDFASEASEESAMAPARDGGSANGDMSATDSAGEAAGTMPAIGLCGTDFGEGWMYSGPAPVDLAVGAPGGPLVETDGSLGALPSGEEVALPMEVTSLEAQTVTTAGPEYRILWDGTVVGTFTGPTLYDFGPADEPMVSPDVASVTLAEGETMAQELSVLMENCWDGSALPAGKYTLVVSQEFAGAAGEVAVGGEVAEPTEPADATEPAEPEMPVEDIDPVEPTVEPAPVDDAGSDDAGTDDGVVDDPVVDELPDVMPVPEITYYRQTTQVHFEVEGDVVDDPFGQYLNPAKPEPAPSEEPLPVPLPGPTEEPLPLPDPAPAPDGTLTPDVVRQMFAASQVGGAWDMEAGTSRWIMNADGDPTRSDSGEWIQYGCAWGGPDVTFPRTSSTMELLTIDASVPRRISVSHGYVVNDNPQVTATVTNASEFTIANWYQSYPELYLAKDGVVVASARLDSLSDQGDARIMELADQGLTIAPDGIGMFAPGQSSTSELLWRDVNSCGASTSPDVTPGTYTLLAATSLHVSNESGMGYGAEGGIAEGGVGEPRMMDDADDVVTWDGTADFGWDDNGDAISFGGSTSSNAAVPEPIMDEPATDGAADWYVYDWVDLQLWSSLGTVVVTR